MKNFRQHMMNIHPCLLEYLDSMLEDSSDFKNWYDLKHGGSYDLIMKYVGTGTTSYNGTVDISKIPNFVDALTSGDLTLMLVKDNHYIRDSLINYSTFVKAGSENAGSFYKQVQVDDNMLVKISCNNVYADNAKLSVQWLPIE
uniref:Uncharacterized protein n=1 Tax=Tectiviridae sp. TaxID=2831614 RepID=A0A8S5VY68_9VIRU|nr:MAG TPA: hypothetical protein [Tectiviridae sp.]